MPASARGFAGGSRSPLDHAEASGRRARLPRFDEWSPDGKTLVETHAFIGDWEVAQAAWAALIKAKPHDRLTLRHGALVHAEQLSSDKFTKKGNIGTSD